ncbi:uncharacterized protein LOC120453738 [Drosophila santomea]|uniref:uncharacterized protein LOC120453738 n=1 Tax=Drosophila santomea TaxID=129105 RepID=UPI001952B7A4|nr:uncharacterized protein LOC120453738 [Drosophila santomea]
MTYATTKGNAIIIKSSPEDRADSRDLKPRELVCICSTEPTGRAEYGEGAGNQELGTGNWEPEPRHSENNEQANAKGLKKSNPCGSNCGLLLAKIDKCLNHWALQSG